MEQTPTACTTSVCVDRAVESAVIARVRLTQLADTPRLTDQGFQNSRDVYDATSLLWSVLRRWIGRDTSEEFRGMLKIVLSAV